VLKRVAVCVAVVAGLSGIVRGAEAPGMRPGLSHAQAPAAAQPAAPEIPKPNDYSDGKAWLCRPGRTAADKDACAIEQTTTVVAADGTLSREAWAANANAPIDCFYVYPTISTDRGDNSDMTPDPAEFNVVKQQFARFASLCKPYAPMYRQITLVGLQKVLAGGGSPITNFGKGIQYDDVKDAWKYYLEHDNRGRGVVIIGHSQVSYILMNLIRDEIDGKPIQSRVVSALILGATLPVAKGKDVGGIFKTMPLCHSATQTGCVINFSSFRSTVPPPATTLFGKTGDPATSGSCTNPAALGGGSADIRAYLDATGQTITSKPPIAAWAEGKTVDTPFVSVPGLLSANCVTKEDTTYLEITVHGNPADPRVDDITGDIGRPTAPLAQWGLHLIDVNLTMGNLLDVVSQQSKTYLAKAKK
jgi:hypothetical protein